MKTIHKRLSFLNLQLKFQYFFPCFFNSYQQVVDRELTAVNDKSEAKKTKKIFFFVFQIGLFRVYRNPFSEYQSYASSILFANGVIL